MSSNADIILMDGDRVYRSLKRMSHEIVEQNTADKVIVLFGIDDRGYALANILADILSSIFDSKVKAIQLTRASEEADRAFKELASTDAHEAFFIVVDDVIFSGQTMFSALKKISGGVNLSEIHTAVLVDRGHRKFPVLAEFCGMELPTKLNEHVSVTVGDGKVHQVSLINREN